MRAPALTLIDLLTGYRVTQALYIVPTATPLSVIEGTRA